MNPKAFLVAMALAAVIGILVGLARGQTFYGSVVGIVTDASGSPVPDTAVTVTNTGTSERHPIATGGDGGYRFVNLVPGS